MASIDVETHVPPSGFGIVRIVFGIIFQAIGLILTLLLAVGVGIWSSRLMIDRGSPLSKSTYGSWELWRDAGREAADPYTRAHFALSGKLRISSDSAGIYEARVDALGARLHSSCDYVIEGANMGGQWWSLAVFDAGGHLIVNDANRYEFTSDTVASSPNGSFVISLGRDAQPGNWIPTSGAGRLVIVFTVLDPATGLSSEARDARNKMLPVIRREGCS